MNRLALVSPANRDVILRLADDPIIIDMATGLKDTPVDELAWKYGNPRYDFMISAGAQYNDIHDGQPKAQPGDIAYAVLVAMDRLFGAEHMTHPDRDTIGPDAKPARKRTQATSTPKPSNIPAGVADKVIAARAAAEAAENKTTTDHCVVCGYDFGHQIIQQTCGSERMCIRRAAAREATAA